MANLIEAAVWEEGVYQFEELDPVKGGPDGVDNLPTSQLANRTLYLKEQVQTLGEGKQPIDALLTAIAALVTSADKIAYFTGADTVALTAFTALARQLLAAVDAASMRAVIGAISQAQLDAAVAALVNSSPTTLDTLKELADALGDDANFAATMTAALGNKQPLDGTLTALAAVVTAADKLIYATGADTFATTPFTAFARTLMAAVDAAAVRTALGVSTIPQQPGEVCFFARNTAPSGFLKANGAAISRTTYADLYGAIGTTFGIGDGATTFNIPDLRGEFLRSWDDSRGVDVGRVFGSWQADELKSHGHKYGNNHNSIYGLSATGTIGVNPAASVAYDTSATGGTETRPRNIALLACIKY